MASRSHREVYNIRDGAENTGVKYEYTMATLLAVRLSFEEDVEDFSLSLNDGQWNYFDDIVLVVKYKNKALKTYAIQVKQRSKQCDIPGKDFCIGKKYNIVHYYEGFEEKQLHNTSLVISTTDICKQQEIDFSKINKQEKVHKWSNVKLALVNEQKSDLHFINTTSQKNLLKFTINNNDTINPMFLGNFYLLSGQSKLENIEDLIRKELAKKFSGAENIAKLLCEFMEHWTAGYKGEHYKLTKNDMIKKIAELLLLPFMEKPFVSQYENQNQNEITLIEKDGISEDVLFNTWLKFLKTFDVIPVKFEEETIREYLWMPLINLISDQLHVKIVSPAQQINEELISKRYSHLIPDIFENFKNGKICLLSLFIALWKLRDVPLLLNDNNDKHLYKLISEILDVYKSNGYKTSFVILTKDTTVIPYLENSLVFHNLKQIGNEKVFEKIIELFPVNIQGRYNCSISDLCEDAYQYITADKLLKMALRKCQIDKQQFQIPYKYIERKLRKTIILKDVLKYEDDVFLIQAENNFSIPDKKNIFLNSNLCHFEKVRKNLSNMNIHLLKPIQNDVDHFEHIRTHGSMECLEKYAKQIEIFDEDVIKSLDRNIKIIAALPGMGKTWLLNKWSLNFPPGYWVAKIFLNDFTEYFQKNKPEENFLIYYHNSVVSGDYFSLSVFNTFMKKKKIVVLLDGFDEIAPYYAENVIKIIEWLDKNQFGQIITTRPSQIEKLKKRFKVFTKVLLHLDLNGQKQLIQNYFPNIPNALDDILELLTSWQSKFGEIPLILRVICDVYKYKGYSYEYIEKVKLFEQYVRTSIEFYKKKFYGDHHSVEFEEKVSLCIEKTKQIALLLYYDRQTCAKYIAHDIDEFLENIRQGKERIGIVTHLTKTGKPVFGHTVISNYLAALWLVENRERAEELVQCLFHVSKSSIRFWVDKILIKDCPLHKAAMDYDLKTLKELMQKDEDLHRKDDGGRTPLHLACSWGPRYNIPSDVSLFSEEEYFYNNQFRPINMEIIRTLVKNRLDPFTKDSIIGANCFSYAAQTHCLLVIEELLTHHYSHITYLEDIFKRESLAYYCAKYNYINILENIFKLVNKYEFYIKCKFGITGKHLLHVAAEYGSIDVFDFLLNQIPGVMDMTNKIAQTPLQIAIKFGKLNLVRKLILHGCNREAKNDFGNTPLHTAAKYKQTAIVNLMLKYNVEVNVKNFNGCTPIYYAIMNEDKKTFKLLVQAGACVNCVDHSGDTLLHFAIENNIQDLLQDLLKLSRNLNARNTKGRTLLHFACLANNITILKKLKNIDMDVQDNEGNTALHMAVEKGNFEIAKFLSYNGANINLQNRLGLTPIMLAIKNGNINIYNLLNEMKANLDCLDIFHNTSLHLALTSGVQPIIEDLIQRKIAYKTTKNLFGKDPLHIAIVKSNFNLYSTIKSTLGIEKGDLNDYLLTAIQANASKIVSNLLENGVNANIKDTEGRSAIQFAVVMNNFSLYEKLLEYGGDIHTRDNKRRSLIHIAVENSAFEILDDLLDKNVDILTKDIHGKSAFYIAAEILDMNICEKLKMHGASVNCLDIQKRTPLHVAVKNNSLDLVKKLLSCKADVNIKDLSGRTAISFAIEQNNYIIYKELKDFYESLELIDDFGMTLLHIAVEYNAKSIVNDLINTGLDIEARDFEGRTPVMTAIISNQCEMFELLKAKGSHLDIIDVHHNTLLHLALMCQNAHIIEDLLKSGADLNKKNLTGRTPIHFAVKWENDDFFYKFQSRCPANLDEIDNYGNTPLHLALFHRKRNMIKWLLENNAQICIRNTNGRNAVHLAAHYEETVFFEHVSAEKLCSEINAKDYYGNTPLDYAKARNAVQIMKRLCHFEDQCTRTVLIADDDEMIGKNEPLLHAFKKWNAYEPIIPIAWKNVNNLFSEFSSYKMNVNSRNFLGRTLLHYAASVNNFELASYLKNNGANLDIQDISGNTSMYIATMSENDRFVSVLYQWGAKINVQNENGSTPLLISIQKSNAKLYTLLKSYGATLEYHNMNYNKFLNCITECNSGYIINDIIENTKICAFKNQFYKDLIQLSIKKNDIVTYRKLKTTLKFSKSELGSFLLTAIKYTVVNIVIDLLACGADISTTNKLGETPLHLAIYFKKFSLYELLVNEGGDINKIDNHQNTALHVAAKQDAVDIVNDILEKNCNVNAANFEGQTALYYAIRNHNSELVRKLISFGAQLDITDSALNTPLHIAVETGASDIVEMLLANRVSVDSKNNMDRTPIFIAIEKRNFAMYKKLLSIGASLGEKDKIGMTLLHLAVKYNCEKVMLDLLARGCYINAANLKGKTPIQISIEINNFALYKKLKDRNANLYTTDVFQNNLLHRAMRANSEEMIIDLLKEGIDVNASNLYGQSPLHFAVRWGSAKVLDKLSESHVNVDFTDNYGNTPLHVAISFGNEASIKWLLKMGANVYIGNRRGRNAIHYAAQHLRMIFFENVTELDSRINDEDFVGQTPLGISRQKGSAQLVECLVRLGAKETTI